MRKKYVVQLSSQERKRCKELIRAGTSSARTLMHARVLLKADSGPEGPGWTDQALSEALEVSTVTIATLRKVYVTQGLEAALSPYRGPNREYERKLDGRQEAQLVALSCGPPPEGRTRWTLRLLADKLVELQYVDSVSHVTVGRTLKKTI